MLAKSSPLQQIQAQRQVLFYFFFKKKKAIKRLCSSLFIYIALVGPKNL